ncbi:MAG TPA: LytTR family DNA-binding domain-containing protein [Thermoanaerobaculia bacterium]
MSLRTVVVDDEPLGRRGIVSRLERSGEVEVVAECRNGREAIDAVRRLKPELLFLDVQMPGTDGFGVLRALTPEECPYVIFVTAHDRHALRAFEVHALDYLVKPIDDERFAEALRRAANSIRRDRDGDLGRKVRAAVGEMGVSFSAPAPRALADRYAVRDRGKIQFVRHTDIDWIGAEGDYIRLHVGSKSWLSRDTLSSVEKTLGRRRFLRIHRSTLVNADRVVEIRTLESGDAVVILKDGTELRMSRSHREAVERLTGRN